MTPYASNTGTLRNLDTLRRHGWRVLLTPRDHRRPREIPYAIDNGAWSAYIQKKPFDTDGFTRLVATHGDDADFVVIPDKVCEGMRSLEFSLLWLDQLRHLPRLLLPVQDGMSAADVGAVLRRYPGLGIFLGGSTEWKLRTMYGWGMVAHAIGCSYHIGRVNTRRRIQLCAEAGATSIDGTSASMFSVTVPMLDAARRQPSLLTPGAVVAGESKLVT
jgi:hypothetical protein